MYTSKLFHHITIYFQENKTLIFNTISVYRSDSACKTANSFGETLKPLLRTITLNLLTLIIKEVTGDPYPLEYKDKPERILSDTWRRLIERHHWFQDLVNLGLNMSVVIF